MCDHDQVEYGENANITITPWEVQGVQRSGIDYSKLIEQFGCKPIDEELLERFKRVTGKKIHPWLKRGIFFAHKDLDKILDDHEAGRPIYLYTGRGPSAIFMHLGHLIPFLFVKWLQSVFDCHVVIQMADDEKFFFKGVESGKTINEYYDMGKQNTYDIMACGFDPEKTYIFSNLMNMNSRFYHTTVKLMAINNGNKMRGIYGMTLDNSIGQLACPCFQCAGAFSPSFGHINPSPSPDKPQNEQTIRCLVPMAIDQDPYFRMARDFVDRYKDEGYHKPATIDSRFLPGLEGVHTKMSTSGAAPVITLNDTPKEVASKIKKYAFSGGKETLEQHRSEGGNPDIDVSFQYLTYFMMDEKRLREIETNYRSGELLTGELKKITIEIINNVLEQHQKAKQEYLDNFKKAIPFLSSKSIKSEFGKQRGIILL